MLFALTALALAEGHKNEPESSAAPARTTPAAAAADSGYELSIRPDPQANVSGFLLVKLKKLTPSAPGHDANEVMVWWTTPAGHRSSFPIRPLADNVWASRLVLEPQAGKNRVSVVILGKSSDGSLGETVELLYELDMPAMKLKFIAQKGGVQEKGGEETKAAPPPEKIADSANSILAVRAKKKAPASVPAIVILVVFANAILFVPALFLVRVYRRFAPAGGFSFGPARAAKMCAVLNPVCVPILAESGLIDRETGRPLLLGESAPGERAGESREAGGGEVANRKDLYEATLIEPAGGSGNKSDSLLKSCSIESIAGMSDGELYELVGALTEEMEKGGVSEDLKKMIRAAERELAQRQSKTEQGSGQDKKVQKTEIHGRHEDNKLDLRDLSF